MDLKQSIQAILFASAKRLTAHKLAILTRKPEEEVEAALKELEEEINKESQPMKIIHEDDTWRLTVKEKYLPVVRKIVKKTELPKTILETLAVVAYKAPVLQSEVISIRTNKAYDHLNFLEENGYISREKKGRTKLIRLAKKFYEYFDIDQEKLKDKFSAVKEMERKINEQEKNATGKNEPETYDITEIVTYRNHITSGVRIQKETLNGLEIYEPKETKKEFDFNEPPTKEQLEKLIEQQPDISQEEIETLKQNIEKSGSSIDAKRILELQEKIKAKQDRNKKPKYAPEQINTAVKEYASKLQPKKFQTKGLFSEKKPEDFDEKVDKRVAEIMGKEWSKDEKTKPKKSETRNKQILTK